MKLNRRRLRRLIKEEYARILLEGYPHGGYDSFSGHGGLGGMKSGMASGNVEACVQECMNAIPPMMKQICGMGMSHMVMNDIYHICEPICQKHGCNPDDIHEMVMSRLG